MARTSLTILLPAAFLLSVLVLLGGYSAFVLSSMHQTLLMQAADGAAAATTRGRHRVEDWLADTQRNLTSTANAKHTRDAIQQLSVIVQSMGPGARDTLHQIYVQPNKAVGTARDAYDYSSDRSAYGISHGKVHDFFRNMRREFGYYDVFLFDATGTLIYTVAKEGDLGQNAVTGDLAGTSLGAAYRSASAADPGSTAFEDFVPYVYSNNDPAAFMATPVLAPDGTRLGVLAVQLPADVLTAIVSDPARDGRAYHFTLLGPDGLYRIHEAGRRELGARPAQTPQIRAAVAGQTGVRIDSLNETGVPVLAAYEPISALGLRWSLVTEVNTAVITAPIRDKTLQTLGFLAIAMMVAAGLGLALGRWIARPLARLTQATQAMMRREPVEIGFQTRADEVGELARGLDRFREDQIRADAARVEMLFKGKAFETSTAMMIADKTGTLLHVNGALTQLFHKHLSSFHQKFPSLDPARLVGTNISAFHHDHSANMAMITSPANAQMVSDIQIGDMVFSLSINTVYDDAGQIAGWVVVWYDVSEQRRVDAILQAVNEAQVVIELAPDGTIVSVNEVALQTYQYDRAELIGAPLAKLMQGGAAHADRVLQQVLANGHLTEFQHRRARDGSDRFVISSLNAIRNRKGDVLRIIAICTDQTEATKARQAADRAARDQASAQLLVVDALRGALEALASGDLTTQITQPFPPEYDSLRLNCNQAAVSLSRALSQVADVSGAILGGARDVASAATELARRTENQAATLEETAAALDTLTANVRTASEGTAHAGSRVTSAHDEAHANGGVVRQAIAAMGSIESSSQQISQIIAVIDDIAFQTNLLALNAGVEAARAGDAGRGFAVVAAEVRALAQRSSEAAKEIKGLISTSEAQVGAGAALVTESGRAVEAIIRDVADISRIVSDIAQSAHDQSNSLAEINAGVAVLDKVTQQNAAMVQQTTAASDLLRQKADELSALLSAFRLTAPAAAGYAVHAA